MPPLSLHQYRPVNRFFAYGGLMAWRKPSVGSIGERIRDRRKTLGLTQVQLAERVGMGQSAISSAESGDTTFLLGPNLLAMSRALRVSARWLQTGVGDPQPPVEPTTDDGIVLDILHALSPAHRAAWIATGNALLDSQSVRTPTVNDPYPTKKARVKA